MLRKVFLLALVLLTGVAPAAAQTTAQDINPSTSTTARQEPPAIQKTAPTSNSSSTPQEPVDEVVRITSKLVQMDVVVTDKNGKQVTDLRPEDFEIFEDGHAQPITHFSYVLTGPASGPLSAEAIAATGSGTIPTPTRPRRERVRRTIAIVVDDLGLSFDTTVTARNALRKFINEQIQPTDLVAIIRTGGKVGALQQFTGDKRLLLAAVERVRWNSCSRSGFRPFPAVGDSTFPRPICSQDTSRVSVAVLRSVIAGLRELPGRKSLIMFGDGFPVEDDKNLTDSGLTNNVRPTMVNGIPNAGSSDSSFPMVRNADSRMNFDPARMLAEMAIRGSVVVYSVDTRGLPVLSINAADDVGGLSGQAVSLVLESKINMDRMGRMESATFAEETGGLFIQNTNNLNLGLDRVMEDQKGYYLIGYRPGSDTFNRRFHRITARVRNRSDLNVRTRTGFYGLTEDETRPSPPTAVDRFQVALASPFGASDIDVRVRPLFTSLPGVGPVLVTRLHVDAQNLSFKEEPGGWRSTQLMLRALLFGDNGRIVDEHRRAFTVRLRGATFERVKSQGIFYVFNMPANKPGAYQFRIAVIETGSSRVGSAGQYVEVPDLKKKELALSGIALSEAASVDSGATPATVDAAGTTRPPGASADAAARRFHRNTTLSYEYLVFNPGEPTGARLTTVVRLFHEGKLVLKLESPVEMRPQSLASQVLAHGRLSLGTELAPGEYVLQVTVTGPTARKGQGTATESADFEIVE
jgi:VWFA-related protein